MFDVLIQLGQDGHQLLYVCEEAEADRTSPISALFRPSTPVAVTDDQT